MGLLSKLVPSKPSAPTCPECGGSKYITKLRTVELAGKSVDVCECKDPAYQENVDIFSKRARSCRVTSFGVLPDGSKVIGDTERVSQAGVDKKTDTAWERKVFPTADQSVAKVSAAIRARFVAPRSTRRYCHTRTCAQFGRQTPATYCGRCGYETLTKGVGIAFPDGLRLAICGNDKCSSKGKRRTAAKLNVFCEECGTELPPDTDKDSDVIAAVAGGAR